MNKPLSSLKKPIVIREETLNFGEMQKAVQVLSEFGMVFLP